MQHLIFVYGTLKRGHGNYFRYLHGHSDFIGEGETVALCRLYNCGFPVLRRIEWGCHKNIEHAPVRGELFWIDDITLWQLDILEGEGRLYHRRLIKILRPDGRMVKAWGYEGSGYWHRLKRLCPIIDGRYVWGVQDEHSAATG